jgi:pimeloyl-ACP methyl ester carboxylesterase
VTTRRIVLLLLAGALSGCVPHMPPPSDGFTAPSATVRAEIARMEAEPAGLTRPLVVITGWRSPGVFADSIEVSLTRLTGADASQTMSLATPFANSLIQGGAAVVRAVEARWPGDDPEWTVEVDVVGYSMGGLVARVAAAPPTESETPRKRLRIRTLYTLSTPHAGTHGWGDLFAPDAAARQMQKESDLLASLNAALPEAGYTLVCYATLNDKIVGAKHAAPPGMDPIWTPADGRLSHFSIPRNMRILADVALRLRGGTPLQAEGSPPPTH